MFEISNKLHLWDDKIYLQLRAMLNRYGLLAFNKEELIVIKTMIERILMIRKAKKLDEALVMINQLLEAGNFDGDKVEKAIYEDLTEEEEREEQQDEEEFDERQQKLMEEQLLKMCFV